MNGSPVVEIFDARLVRGAVDHEERIAGVGAEARKETLPVACGRRDALVVDEQSDRDAVGRAVLAGTKAAMERLAIDEKLLSGDVEHFDGAERGRIGAVELVHARACLLDEFDEVFFTMFGKPGAIGHVVEELTRAI